jgi:alanyl-tRNA synthetase
LHAALRSKLGDTVRQKGSNINRERMRFDFSFERAMKPEEVKQVEGMVQQWIDADLPVERTVMPLEQARASGAIGLFADRYGDEVSVYRIGDVSLEFCGGPHVNRTSEIGRFHIKKEQSSSAGVRRIRAEIS